MQISSIFLNNCKRSDLQSLRKLRNNPLDEDVINYKDINGLTGFAYCCLKGDIATLRVIQDINGIDVNCIDKEGNTPLILASSAGHSSLISFLINKYKKKISIDQRNYFGFTALMKAAIHGKVKCVKLLLSSGADTLLRDPKKGLTALEWSKYCGRFKCAEKIEKFKKKVKNNNNEIFNEKINEKSSENDSFIITTESFNASTLYSSNIISASFLKSFKIPEIIITESQ